MTEGVIGGQAKSGRWFRMLEGSWEDVVSDRRLVDGWVVAVV